MTRNLLKYWASAMLIMTSLSSYAAQGLSFTLEEKIKASISAKNLNRIAFGINPFSQIIGDESKYSIFTDTFGMNLFITPKVPAGETFELSVINVAGQVIDFALQVKDIEGQIINIYEQKPENIKIISSGAEIAEMLKHMIQDEQGKYYVKHINRKLTAKVPDDLEIIQDRTYRYRDLTGARLFVKAGKGSKGSKGIVGTIELNDTAFMKLFNNTKAVSIEEKSVSKSKSCYVWIVTGREAGK
jgi:hypothetical protein